ncbi:Ulp1 protease family [Theobroma cacao]|nr:Ulp1 protease family [Theobroma cacao]WRX22601.1 Ulp1 protease family [Theobroma cacao]
MKLTNKVMGDIAKTFASLPNERKLVFKNLAIVDRLRYLEEKKEFNAKVNKIVFLDHISGARFYNKYGQHFLPRIAVWNQEKVDGWLTRIKDFKNPKNVQAYIITPTMDMKSEGKLSFDSHLFSQIKDICKCVDNKEELKSEIKSLKYEIEKLKGLLEYDKNNQQLKEKKNEGDKEYLVDAASFAPTLVNKEHLSYQIHNVKQKVYKNVIKKSSEEKIVDFIDIYAIRSEMMTLEPRKWLDDTDYILRNPATDFKDLNQRVLQPYRSSIQNCEMIFVPMNDSNMHWYLCVLNLKEKVIKVFDSLPLSRGETRRLNAIKKVVAYFEKLFEGTLFASKVTCWEIIVPNDVPRQSNSYDCAMYVCKFMQTVHLNSYHEVCVEELDRSLLLAYLVKHPHNKNRSVVMNVVHNGLHNKNIDYDATRKYERR